VSEKDKKTKLISARVDEVVANGVDKYAEKTGIKKQRVIENFLKEGLDRAES
jgi:antitoxin component of RelBE/YafQ-DinJ toxin-antitoxin module